MAPALKALSHRGPDAEGSWRDGRCTLVNARLAVIDTSEAGQQPMTTPDQAFVITFNGEIYNYRALRAELEANGIQFSTGTDTEVLLAAYRRWGPSCLDRLKGMFAFAVWEPKRRVLFIARDRVGKKPLFFFQGDGYFRFASELQGLLSDRVVPRRPDLSSIDRYLSWGYIPAPWTGFESIHKLPPAHWMTVDLSDEREPVVRSQRWWDLSFEPKSDIAESDAAEMLRERLTQAVAARMMGDVPVGAFLSGGVDSSAVVGLMAECSTQPVRTFSLGFAEADFNELEHARRVASRFATDHQEIVVGPEAVEVLPQLVRHYGEPFADSSAIPTFFVSRAARRHVTVVLTGEGGDEAFAGYERHRANRLAERLAVSSAGTEIEGARDPVLAEATRPMGERYARWIALFDDRTKRALYGPALRPFLERPASKWIDDLVARSDARDSLDVALSIDIRSYLPDDLLVKVDVASMANGLEARCPFLDDGVLEFAARLPSIFKLRGARTKHLLLEACDDLIPQENRDRPKMGFGAPIRDWLRGPLRGQLEEVVLSKESATRGYVDRTIVTQLFTDHLDGRMDHTHRLWSLLVLEYWHREFLDR
jgi:asparagine synthase (glutamine-hydrolysing)